jgi:predicted small lipoprotein YifL
MAAVLLCASASLAACGKQGVLEQPAPLFGTRAKAQYEAQKAQEARDDAQRAAQRPASSTSSGNTSTGNDDAPRTTREVLDPAQKLTPASRAPIPGAPNPMGAPVQPSF